MSQQETSDPITWPPGDDDWMVITEAVEGDIVSCINGCGTFTVGSGGLEARYPCGESTTGPVCDGCFNDHVESCYDCASAVADAYDL